MEENKVETSIPENSNFDIKKLMKLEIIKLLEKFINEIDLSFEYIEKIVIEKCNKQILKLNDDELEFNKFIENYIEKLKKYENILYKVMSSKVKVKTEELNFLNDVSILDLELKLLSNENKNTKKTLIKYLYNIYMNSCVLYNFNNLQDENFEGLLSFMNEFKLNIENIEKQEQQSSSNKPKNKKRNISRKTRPAPDMNLFNNLLGSNFSANPQIMNIANDIVKDIETNNIDPMSILTSMMSGNSNPTVNNLIQNITTKLEDKINNGEIDTKELEQQATTMIDAVQKTPLLKSFLSNANLQNFTKKK